MSALLVVSVILSYGAHSALGQFVPTVEDMENWLATTSANVTYILNSNFDGPVFPSDIRIIGCSERVGSTCGGECWAYQAAQGGQCMPLDQLFYGTVCFGMTGNLPICNGSLCSGECDIYTNCGELLDHNFCYAPEATSVQFYQFSPDVRSSELSRSTASVSGSSGLGVTSSLSLSESVTSTPLPSGVTSTTETQSQTLPVGAIVGIAIGSALAILSILLSFCYVRRRQHRRRNLNSKPEPFTAAGWSALATVLPSPQYLRPKKTTRSDDTPDGPPSTSNLLETDHSSSDVSTPMEITHTDSGVRIASSTYPPRPRAVLEHPPPYTTA